MYAEIRCIRVLMYFIQITKLVRLIKICGLKCLNLEELQQLQANRLNFQKKKLIIISNFLVPVKGYQANPSSSSRERIT